MIFPMLPIFTALNTVLAEEEAERQAKESTEKEWEYKTTCADTYKKEKIPFGVCADTYKKEKIPFGVCMVDIPNTIYCVI